MVEMLSFLEKNCDKIDNIVHGKVIHPEQRIHPNHDLCNYNFKIPLPKIVIKPLKELKASTNISYYFAALYSANSGEILLSKESKGYNLILGLVVHELFHYIQDLNGDLGENICNLDEETTAIIVQYAYSKKVLDSDFRGTTLGHFEMMYKSLEEQVLKHGVKCRDKSLYKWYEGEYKDSEYHGYGTFYYPHGGIYKGQWRNGKKHGEGTFTVYDKFNFSGNWLNGNFNGFGTLKYDHGKYEGEWKDWKKSGQGTFTWTRGHKYVGEWKENKRNGKGTFTWTSGNKYVGEWKKNKQWNGKKYDKNGKIILEWVNGKKQK